MSAYFPEIEEIYFAKTKEYMQEVVSSYAIGNYRSATVMLYSVAICDLLFKLQELKDMYNDTIANSILKEVEKSRNNHDNKAKSKWEKELVDNIYEKTQLLDLEAYTNLNHLYDHRNFSAHPALNENYELVAPSKETTIANIKNVLKDILIKPPIFIKNIVDTLTEDLKNKNDLYENEYDKLATYLNNKYFSKMPNSMKLSTLKAFWKFCFCLPENEDCHNNLIINRQTIEILISGFQKEAIDYIKENKRLFSVENDDACQFNLVVLLSKYPTIYSVLDSDTLLQIDKIIEKHSSAKALSWFKYKSCKDHLKSLKSDSELDLRANVIKEMVSHYSYIGETKELMDFFVWYYGNSFNFNIADYRFKFVVEPYLNKMSSDQFKQIIINTNENRQIYGRNMSKYANNKIMEFATSVLGQDFDYTQYPHFEFDSKNLNYNDDNIDSNETDIDIDLPFFY